MTGNAPGAIIAAGLALAALLAWISPFLLLPMGATVVATRGGRLFPEYLRDPIRRLAWLTCWATLPVALVDLVLFLGKSLAPPEDFYRLMLGVYDLEEWAENQIWLKPIVLAPLVAAAGVLSITLQRAEIVARLGSALGLVGKASLAVYVLSLFTLVGPGPFERKLGQTTSELHDALVEALEGQRISAELYLAYQAVNATLHDNPAARSNLAAIVKADAAVRRRLGCSLDVRASILCWPARDLAQVFKNAMPGPRATRVASDPPPPATRDPRALRQAISNAEARKSLLDEKQKAVREAIDAFVSSMTDLLPFGSLVNNAVDEMWEAVVSRFGDRLTRSGLALATASAERIDQLAAQSVVEVSAALADALGKLRDAIVQHGPLTLMLGLGASDEAISELDKIIDEVQGKLAPGETVHGVLTERGGRNGYGPNRFNELVKERTAPLKEHLR